MTPMLGMILAAIGAVALVAGQWSLHRMLDRRAVAGLKSRHLQQQANLNRKLEQAKRQLAQLQQELAAARLELKQRRERAVPPPVPAPMSAREALSRQLDAEPQRPRLPIDGFADTLPAAQYPHAHELLMR